MSSPPASPPSPTSLAIIANCVRREQMTAVTHTSKWDVAKMRDKLYEKKVVLDPLLPNDYNKAKEFLSTDRESLPGQTFHGRSFTFNIKSGQVMGSKEHPETCVACSHLNLSICIHRIPTLPLTSCDVCLMGAGTRVDATFSGTPARCERHWYFSDPSDASECPSCRYTRCSRRCHMLHGETDGYTLEEWYLTFFWSSPTSLSCRPTCVFNPCHPIRCFYSVAARDLLWSAYKQRIIPCVPAWIIDFLGVEDIPYAAESYHLPPLDNLKFDDVIPCYNCYHIRLDKVPAALLRPEQVKNLNHSRYLDLVLVHLDRDVSTIVIHYAIDTWIGNRLGFHCDFCLREHRELHISYHPKDREFSVHTLKRVRDDLTPHRRPFRDDNCDVIHLDEVEPLAIQNAREKCLKYRRFYRNYSCIGGIPFSTNAPYTWTAFIRHETYSSCNLRENRHDPEEGFFVDNRCELKVGDELTLNYAAPLKWPRLSADVRKQSVDFELDYYAMETLYESHPAEFFAKLESRQRCIKIVRGHLKFLKDGTIPEEFPVRRTCPLPPLPRKRRNRQPASTIKRVKTTS